MKRYIPLKLKMFIKNVIYFFNRFIPEIIFLKTHRHEDKVILLEAPTYSNLGDQAILYAEKSFFQDKFPERLIIEVSGYRYYWYEKFLLKFTKTSDLFISIGAGNFGDEYLSIEKRRVRSLKIFEERPFVIFPQTIFYHKNYCGAQRIQIMQQAIIHKKRLLIFAREKVSYDLFEEIFSQKAILAPDIVLYLQKSIIKEQREYLLLCLRSDCEKKESFSKEIYNLLRENFDKIIETDTSVDFSIDYKDNLEILENKWNEFKKAKLVITDRLHGMIFCAITGTPCIVLPNYNHKITSFYFTWLESLSYVHYVKSMEEIKQVIQKLDFSAIYNYDDKIFEKNFTDMEISIRGLLDECKE